MAAISGDFPSIDVCIQISRDTWIRDINELYKQAASRFGDVSFPADDGSDQVWGHKGSQELIANGMITGSFIDLHMPTISPDRLQNPSDACFPSSMIPSDAIETARLKISAHDSSYNGSLGKAVATGGSITRQAPFLDRPSKASALIRAQLETFYTGQGLGTVMNRITHSSDPDANSLSVTQREGNTTERYDRISQDYMYMWRSRLYADIQIRLFVGHNADHIEQEGPIASDCTDTIFSCHRPVNDTLLLPSTAFTPTATHLCLGYMYSGRLDLNFDFNTALAVHRAAAFLQIEALVGEIESRLVYGFCHGMRWTSCRCAACTTRVEHVWSFANETTAISLEERSRAYLVEGWSKSWMQGVGSAEESDRSRLLTSVLKTITSSSVIAAFQDLQAMRDRLSLISSSLRATSDSHWLECLFDMSALIYQHILHVLCSDFESVGQSRAFTGIRQGQDLEYAILQDIMARMVEHTRTSSGCVYAPALYQAIANLIENTGYSSRDSPRNHSILIKSKWSIGENLRYRLLDIQSMNGFDRLTREALNKISQDTGIPLSELSASDTSQTLAFRMFSPVPSSRNNPTMVGQKACFQAHQPQFRTHRKLAGDFASNTLPAIAIDTSIHQRHPASRSSIATVLSTTQSSYRSYRAVGSEIVSSAVTRPAIAFAQRPNPMRNGPLRSTGVPSTDQRGTIIRKSGPSISRSTTIYTDAPALVTPTIDPIASAAAAATIDPIFPGSFQCALVRASGTAQHKSDAKRPSSIPGRKIQSDAKLYNESNSSFKSAVNNDRTNTDYPRTSTYEARAPSDRSGRVSSVDMAVITMTARNPHRPPRCVRQRSEVLGMVLEVPMRCVVALAESKERFPAWIRYIGRLDTVQGAWVGVEIEVAPGLTIRTLPDGCLNGVNYFKVADSRSSSSTNVLSSAVALDRRALFIRPVDVVYVMHTH
ncbi:hypothetical protein IAU60_001400 [Kwoniella sp. DSM 27419]